MKDRLEQLLVEWKKYHQKLMSEYECEIADGVKSCIDDLENLLNGGEYE